MSARWSGPWVQAVDADGTATPLPEAAWQRGRLTVPAGTVKIVVRWREPDSANPRKRTLPVQDEAEVLALSRRIAAARLLDDETDQPGAVQGPAVGPVTGSFNGVATGGQDQHKCSDTRADAADRCDMANNAGTPPLVPLFQSPTAPAAAAPATRPSTALGLAQHPAVPDQRSARSSGAPTGPPTVPPGRTIEEYKDRIVRLHQPVWDGNNDDSTPLQLQLMSRMFVYRDGDPLLQQYPDLRVGGSIHLSVLSVEHCEDALAHRRCVDFGALRRNDEQTAKYLRLLAEYEAKIAAYRQATGYRGRPPSPPAKPTVRPAECTLAEGARQPLIQPRTEQMFVRAAAFVLDRASEAGLMPQGNVHKRWRSGRQAEGPGTRTAPFRKPSPTAAADRTWPGLGFVVDLGDVLAGRGGRVQGLDGVERRNGERYRYLPAMVTMRALRPGEGVTARPGDCDGHEHVVRPESGGRLKGRPVGEVRVVPVSELDVALQRLHVASGYTSRDGYLFSSPAGCQLDKSNFKDDFLGPAMNELLGEDGLWADAGSRLVGLDWDWYLMRKIGISVWLAHGLDTSIAAQQAGHREEVQNATYKGLIRGARSRVWTGMDACIQAALSENPPRGDGELARLIRTWLSADGVAQD